MDNNPIRIGRTRSYFFTKAQKSKLDAGIEILLKVIKHQQFSENLLQFHWSNSNNRRFHRFYHASGLSNKQVLERILNFSKYFEEVGYNDQLVILPFNSRREIQSYNGVNNPIVWISLNCINNKWYSPVHVASAIGYELAMLLGLDSSMEQASRSDYSAFKVPNFLGRLIMETAEVWKHNITDIADSFDQIDKSQYNYFPASSVLGSVNVKASQHHQTSFDNLITSLLIEQESLISLQDNLTLSETTRLICLEEVLLNLNRLKTQLAESSLDGSELDFQIEKQASGSRRSN